MASRTSRSCPPKLEPIQRFFYHFGAILIKDNDFITGSIFGSGVALAMILPVIMTTSRDVFARTPRHNIKVA